MQLVELQRTVQKDAGAEIAVVAISYDPVSTLASFAAKHDIEYPLLSDEGSHVITRIGLLNEGIEDEREFWGKPMTERHVGLPYPGTFLLDAEGIVTEKIFERSHRVRPSGTVLMDRLQGPSPGRDLIPERASTESSGPLALAVWTDEPTYFPNQVQRLRVRLVVDDGFHVYVPPVPDGYHPLTVTVDGPDHLLIHPAQIPAGETMRIESLGETFTVADGVIDVLVPFYVLDGAPDASVPFHRRHVDADFCAVVTVSAQACTNETCFLPQSIEIPVRIVPETRDV